MSSPVNGRPLPPPAPSKRAQPVESTESRATGVRPRSDAPEPLVVGAPIIRDAPSPPSPERSSIPPESLRKPFASLIPEPRKRSSTGPIRPSDSPSKRSATGPRPQVDEGPNWDEKSSLSSLSSAPGRSSRAMCKKHKITRRSDGVCMLCRKEEIEQENGRGWKIIVALMAIAVIGGGIVAAII